MTSQLPAQHRALVLDTIEDGFHVKTVSTPKVELGTAVIKIEVAGVLSYHREIYNGARQYDFHKPLTGGCSAIGRIAALGADATTLKEGQLVLADCVIHGRDDPDSLFLIAIHQGETEGSKKLSRNVWRNGTFAEYARLPLENCIPLNEARLCGDLGYTVDDLMYIWYLLVPYGGLRDIGLEPGETIVVSPATGGYGGAGVQVAVAMGARVIAMGRNEAELARLREHVIAGSPGANIETVKMTGDEMADAATRCDFGTIDAVIDFSPPQASKSPHVRSAVRALRRGGRVSLMGWNESPTTPAIIFKNISLRGKLMYERADILQFVKMLERGLFPKGKHFVDTKVFELEDWKAGLDAGAEHMGIGKHVVFKP